MNNNGQRALLRRILLAVPLLLALSALGATEHAVSEPALGTPPERRDGPVLATSGDGFLAVWRDTRAFKPSLVAARVTAAGEVLDPTGILLTSESGGPARIVWTGERYLVFFPIGRTIMLTSVDGDGNAAPSRPILENAADISVATNGSRILIAYEGDAGSTLLVPPRPYVAVLDMEGSVISSARAATFRHANLAPSVVALRNGEFVLAWNAYDRGRYALNGIRLDAGGVRQSPSPVPLGFAAAETTLHTNGDALVAVSSTVSWGMNADLTAATEPKPRPAGAVFQWKGTAAIVGEKLSAGAGPDSPRAIQITPLDAKGHAGAAIPVAVATPDGAHALGEIAALQSGSKVLVSWASYHKPTFSAFRLLSTLADAGSLSPLTETFELTVSAAAQFNPATAAGTSETLVAWQEADRIRAARIDDAGRHLDGHGIVLSEKTPVGPPRVVFHEGRYAVTFTEGDEIVVRFITPTGELSNDRVRVPVSAAPQRIAAASGGGTLLLAWTEGQDVLATRVHPSLTTDPPVIVSSEVEMGAVDPAAAWNGSSFLIAWVHQYTFDGALIRPVLSARRVSPELSFAGPAVEIAGKGAPSEWLGMPAVASDGKDWFVASASFVDTSEILVTRIGADGAPAGRVFAGRGSVPELAWTGRTLSLAFRQEAGALTVAPIVGPGVAQTLPGHPATGPEPSVPAELAYDQAGITARNGRWIAVYHRVADAPEGFVPRVFATFSGSSKPKARALR